MTFSEFLESITFLQQYNFGAFISLAFLIIIYKILEPIIVIESEIKRWKLRVAGALIIILIVFLCSVIGIRSITNHWIAGYIAKDDYEEEMLPAPSSTNTPTPISVPSNTPTQTLTPTPASVSELKICKHPETQFPCRYYIRENDIAKPIAEKVYGKDHVDQAGRISELYRNEKGEIMTYIVGNEVVIPDWSIPLDEQYYEYYFQLIPNPIRKCDARFWFPCWYVSDGEPLDILIGLPDTDIDETCFQQANRSTYNIDTKDTETKSIGEGAIFVYPICQ